MPPVKSSKILFWHGRYQRQAEWTKSLRYHLYRRVSLCQARNILDLGCGTGVIAHEVFLRTGAEVWGLDREPETLKFAQCQNGRDVHWILGRAEDLPFAAGSFDLILTHYFWMWLRQPGSVIRECLRTLRRGGYLVALAEPDYSQRQDEPAELGAICQMLAKDLRDRGADPLAGAKIAQHFRRAELETETGAMSQGWGPEEHRREFRHQWAYVEEVLRGCKCLRSMKKMERTAIGRKERRSVMPIHWAVGRKRG